MKADDAIILLWVVSEYLLYKQETREAKSASSQRVVDRWSGRERHNGRTQASILAPDSMFGSVVRYHSTSQSQLRCRVLGTSGGLTRQHRDHTQQDLLNTLHWTPSLARRLVRIGIISWGMQDGNAHVSRSIDCKVVKHRQESIIRRYRNRSNELLGWKRGGLNFIYMQIITSQ